MKFSKQILIVLSSVGLIGLGAYSSQASLDNSSTLFASSTITEAQQPDSLKIAQSFKPATQTGEVRMTLSGMSTPLKPGKQKLTLMVINAKTGKPTASKDVQVTLTMSAKEMDAMGMKGMGEGSAKTQVKPASSPGIYDIETTVPFAGNWQLKVDLKQAKPPANAVFNLAVK